jgi:cytochrome P450
MSDPRTTGEFFINVAAKLADPFDDWRWFRANAPLFFYEPVGAWWVFDYAHVDALFHDARLSNQRMGGFLQSAPPEVQPALEGLVEIAKRWVLMRDGADHMQLRRALGTRFGEHYVRPMAEKVQMLIDELLENAPPALDIAADFAHKLPAMIIGDLMGARREDRASIVEWSDGLASFFNSVPPTVDIARGAIEGMEGLRALVRGLIAERRTMPREDVVSELLHPQAGSALGEEDIVSNCIVLLLAGHETTRNAIGSGLWLLLTHPDQMAALRADDGLMHNAVEEILRFEPPNPFMARIATEDVDLDGQVIRKGQMAFLMLGSANRDDARFPDGDRFDIHRAPGRHLAFGSGPHYCLGSVLARLEMTLALTTLLKRFPNLRLDPDRAPRFVHQMGLRGPVSLPVLT